MSLLLLLAGCGSLAGHNYLTELSCEHDAYGWAGGLTRWIDQGPGDGTFDIQPPEVEIDRVQGSYDTETGDFSYTVAFAPGYYLERATYEGYGVAYQDGDLDVLYTEAVTDVLGQQYVRVVRSQRTGCETTGNRTDWYATADEAEGAERDWTFSLLFEADDLATGEERYEAGAETYLRERTLHGDFTEEYATTLSASTYDYEATGFRAADATIEEDFLQTGFDGSAYEGTTLQAFDGSVHQEYSYSDVDGTLLMTCVFDYAYDGSGEGTCSYTEAAGGYDCDISITAEGDCTYACVVDGQTYEGTC